MKPDSVVATTRPFRKLIPNSRPNWPADPVCLAISIEIDKLEAQREGIANVKCTLNVEKLKLVRGPGIL